MRVFQHQHASRLLRSAAFVALAGFGTGCSADMSRFQDGMFTGSINRSSAPQATVGNQQMPVDQQQTAAVQPVYSGASAHRTASAAAPKAIQRNELAPAAGAARKAAEPMVTASVAPDEGALTGQPAVEAEETVRPSKTASSKPRSEKAAEGWSKAGGTHVALGEGETIYNLSRRFGVPANAIMEANGISDASSVQAGQRLLIPTYVYSRTAPVSAPDNDPKTADASSSKGAKRTAAAPQEKLPQPGDAPSRDVAVLPSSPSGKERKAADSTMAADAAAKKAAAEPAKPAVSGDSYVVQSGDSLYGISRKTGIPVAELKKSNSLKDGKLKIGQTLALKPGVQVASAAKPSKTDAVDPVVTGETKPLASAKPAETKAAGLPEYTPPKADEKVIEQAEQDVAAAAPSATGVSKMRWPAKGRVVAAYGARSGSGKNAGIDIAVPKGTPVKAAENGVVIYAGDGLKEFGKTVLVRHENGLVSVYGHNGELNVERGQTVKRGQDIAKSGMTGNADTPKLHFEVRKDSKPVDPGTYLE